MGGRSSRPATARGSTADDPHAIASPAAKGVAGKGAAAKSAAGGPTNHENSSDRVAYSGAVPEGVSVRS